MNLYVGQRVEYRAVNGNYAGIPSGAFGTISSELEASRNPAEFGHLVRFDGGAYGMFRPAVLHPVNDPPALGSWHALRKIWQPKYVGIL